MKTLQNIGKSLIVASLVILTSCSKDDNNNNNNQVPLVPANSSFITGKVNGTAFSSIIFGTSTASCSKGGSGNQGYVTVLGGDLSGNSITVFLSGTLATGTYNVNSSTDSFLNYSPSSGQYAYSTGNCDAASGTITVTVSDATHIEGTFAFVGRDTDNCSESKTITEGVFKGVYPAN